MKRKKTNRGFSYIEFTDLYDQKYSIQKSSLATKDAIWLGIDDPNPIIMASDASKYNIETTETTGWIPYPIPEEVSINTRMHLSVKQVKKLISILQRFVDTGKI